MRTVFHIFFPVFHACLLWVAAIFSDNRSTRLLPEPLWVVEMHHTTQIISHFVLSTGTLTNMVDSCSQASSQCLKKGCVSESFWRWTSQKDKYNLWKHENMTEKVVQLRLSCDGEGKSFLLGVLFVSKHLNCSGKERFRRLLSLSSELLLTADQRRNTVLHRLVLIMDHTSRTRPQRH